MWDISTYSNLIVFLQNTSFTEQFSQVQALLPGILPTSFLYAALSVVIWQDNSYLKQLWIWFWKALWLTEDSSSKYLCPWNILWCVNNWPVGWHLKWFQKTGGYHLAIAMPFSAYDLNWSHYHCCYLITTCFDLRITANISSCPSKLLRCKKR